MKKIKITLEDKPKEKKRKYSKYPRLDMSALAFASPEQAEQIQVDYIKQIESKAKRRILIPTIIIFVLLLTTVCAFSTYLITDYNSQINSINSKLERRESDIKDRDSKIAKLNNEISDLKNNSNDTSTSSSGNLATYQIRAKHSLEQKGYYDNNSENNAAISTDSASYTRTCAYPDCDRTAQNGSYYCYSHECSKSGCHEQIANDYSRYCYIHKCRIVDCNNGASNGGVYCSRHECIYPGCHKKKTGISYCSEHEK